MTRRSQYSRDFQDRRHARGLCTQCGAPHVNKSNRTKVLARLCVACTNQATERDRRADGATLLHRAEQAETTAGDAKREIDRLVVRCGEFSEAHAASFKALHTLSAALFDGEVDDYAALAEKVIARVRQAESDGATLRERVRTREQVEAALTDAVFDTGDFVAFTVEQINEVRQHIVGAIFADVSNQSPRYSRVVKAAENIAKWGSLQACAHECQHILCGDIRELRAALAEREPASAPIAGGWLKPDNVPHYRRPAAAEVLK